MTINCLLCIEEIFPFTSNGTMGIDFQFSDFSAPIPDYWVHGNNNKKNGKIDDVSKSKPLSNFASEFIIFFYISISNYYISLFKNRNRCGEMKYF